MLFRTRLESIIINAKVALLLLAVWLAGRKFVGCNSDDGFVSYLSVSIALDTTIAVKWVQNQFTQLFTRNIISFSERCTARQGDRESMPQDSFGSLMEHAKRLARRFGDIMAFPSVVYPMFGISATLAMLALLYTGIPECAKDFLIIAPFPAFAYYGTALLAYIDIFVQLNGSYLDRKHDATGDDGPPPPPAASDPNVDAVAKDAEQARRTK